MRTYLGLGCVALIAAVGSAAAADNDGISVTTTVGPFCSLTTLLEPTEVLSPPFYPGEHNLGTLGYTCNFGNDYSFPSLKIKAVGGTLLVNGTDGHTVQYEVKWTVPLTTGPMPFQTATTTTTFGSFSGEQGPLPNVEQTGSVIVKLQADLTHAGTYTDTLEFSVSP
jgi:hypothetical protein